MNPLKLIPRDQMHPPMLNQPEALIHNFMDRMLKISKRIRKIAESNGLPIDDEVESCALMMTVLDSKSAMGKSLEAKIQSFDRGRNQICALHARAIATEGITEAINNIKDLTK